MYGAAGVEQQKAEAVSLVSQVRRPKPPVIVAQICNVIQISLISVLSLGSRA